MFNMSGSEMIFIVLLALVVLGPEKLPEAMRRAGRAYGEFKRMTSSFQSEFRSHIDEPMREMRDTADLIRRNVDLGAAEVEKPKSKAAMSVDMEPDPPPADPVELDAADDDDEDDDDTDEVDDTAEQRPIDEGEPPARDEFGAVPSYADDDGNGEGDETNPDETTADERVDPEPTR